MSPFSRIALASSLALVSLGTVVSAQAPAPANANPAAIHSGHYAVEPSHTRVGFAVSHIGFTDWFGDFTGVSGTLSLDPRNVASAKVDVTIPTASVVTTNAKLDEELRSADWFDAGKYPTIRFVSTKVTKTGARSAAVTGNLTFHGVTRPVTLEARFNAGGVNPLDKAYTVGFNATAHIRRSDFGVKTYLPLIGDDVAIRISAAFEQKA